MEDDEETSVFDTRRIKGVLLIDNKFFPLIRTYATVGRQNSDILLNYAFVSSQHAEIKLGYRNVFVKDLNSKNGTYLNEEKLSPECYYQIKHGDIIDFGGIEAKYINNNNEHNNLNNNYSQEIELQRAGPSNSELTDLNLSTVLQQVNENLNNSLSIILEEDNYSLNQLADSATPENASLDDIESAESDTLTSISPVFHHVDNVLVEEPSDNEEIVENDVENISESQVRFRRSPPFLRPRKQVIYNETLLQKSMSH